MAAAAAAALPASYLQTSGQDHSEALLPPHCDSDEPRRLLSAAPICDVGVFSAFDPSANAGGSDGQARGRTITAGQRTDLAAATATCGVPTGT